MIKILFVSFRTISVMTSQNSQPIISEYLQYLTDLLTSGSSRGKFSTTHLGRISCSKPLGLWSGIFFMWVEIEDRKESMLKRELNTTTSETRLQEQNQYKESQGVGLFLQPRLSGSLRTGSIGGNLTKPD